MKKIGIFTGYFLPHLGGVERYNDKLAEQLKKLGYEIVIVTCNHKELPSYEKGEYTIYRLPVYNIVKDRYPILRKNKEYRELMSKVEKENLDYIICNTRFYINSLNGANLGNKLNIPVLLIEHGSSHFTVNNKILDFFGAIYEHFLTLLLKKKVNGFYGVSNRCNNWLRHFKIKATGIFYNSIDDTCYNNFCNSKYKKDFENKIVITYAGRIIKEKGICILLDAFVNLSKQYDNIVLVIAGDGPLLKKLKDNYKEQNIFFEGKLNYEDVMSLYNVTDIFVHPSMFPEGLPTAILEAGIMKCAIIATDRGGTKEVINESKYGIIVEENQMSVENNIKYLLENNDELEKLKNNIHNRIINEFVWKNTAKVVDKELQKYGKK